MHVIVSEVLSADLLEVMREIPFLYWLNENSHVQFISKGALISG